MTGYKAPNHTQIPNELLDVHLADMKDAELRVVLSIARKTLGWHKQYDRISLTQLQKMTGMSRQGVLNGIADAVDRGIVERIEHEVGSYEYGLVVNEVDQPVNEVDQQLVNEVDTQKKVVKETNYKETPQSVDGSGWDWIYLMYLDVFKEAVSAGEHDALRDLAQVYTQADVKEAMTITHDKHSRQRLTRKVAYMRGILRDWAANGKPAWKQGAKPIDADTPEVEVVHPFDLEAA